MMSKELQRPGAGLPGLERFLIGGFLMASTAFSTKARLLQTFEYESKLLWELIDDTDIPLASQQQLIPRMMGLEDSSRNWSLLMVLEHLCMVNSDVLKIIRALRDGMTPRGTLDVADYKPDPDVDLDVIERFKQVNQDLTIEVRSAGSLRTASVMRHPWFGLMDAHRWFHFAGVHQKLHRRHAHKIQAMIGRV